MRKTVSFERRIHELKKLVSILEWDMPHIQDNRLRAIKEEQLMRYKRELEGLLEETGCLIQ